MNLKEKLKKFKICKEYTILLIIILLNIAIRIPIIPHEMGSDSFVYHSLTNSILAEQKIKWDFSLSDLVSTDVSSLPAINSLDLAMLRLYTGLSIEELILLFSIFLGMLGVFSSYLMAREIFKGTLLRVLAVLLFSLSPTFISISLFTISTRGLFMAVLPLLIWSFLRLLNTGERSHMLLCLLFFALLVPVHHLFFLTYAFLGAFIVTEAVSAARRKLNPQDIEPHLPTLLFLSALLVLAFAAFMVNRMLGILQLNALLLAMIVAAACLTFSFKGRFHQIYGRMRNISNASRLALPMILVLVLVALLFLQFFSGLAFFERLKYGYKSGLYFNGDSNYIVFLNMCIDYGSSMGILLPFALAGFLLMLKNVNENKTHLFFLISFLACSSILIHGEYMTIFLLPVCSIFITLGLIGAISKLKKHPRLLAVSTVVCISATLLFSMYMTEHWTFKVDRAQNREWLQDRTIYSALFLDGINRESANVTTNNGAIISRITVLISKFSVGWIYEIMPYSYDDTNIKRLISEKDIGYVVEDKNIPNHLTGSSQLYPAPFLVGVRSNGDRIYDNGLEIIWVI